MDGYSQIIAMPKQTRKIVFSILIISILSFLIFWSINYTKINLASFSGMITAWVTINPLGVVVSVPAEVETGKVFKIEARAINKGEEKIENAKGEIFLPDGLVLLGKDPVKEIGVIPGKRERGVSWQVRGKEGGSYIVSVKVSGELKGQIISAEDSALVEVKESVRKTGPRSWFQGFFDFFSELF